ncbi:MAG: hypothetical protein WBD31_01465, partial [Rubripirellula sp.]
MDANGDGIGTCLVCGDPVRTRGLCTRHYTQFHRRRAKMTPVQADAFELKLIEEGLLAAPKPAGPAAKDDPFADIASLILSDYPIKTASVMK